MTAIFPPMPVTKKPATSIKFKNCYLKCLLIIIFLPLGWHHYLGLRYPPDDA